MAPSPPPLSSMMDANSGGVDARYMAEHLPSKGGVDDKNSELDDDASDADAIDYDNPPVAEGGNLLKAPVHLGQGDWFNAACHIVTAVPTPAAVMTLSFAVSRVGWTPGLLLILAGGVVTGYTNCLLAKLNVFNGKRHARYRDLAYDIWGMNGAYLVLFFQIIVNIGANVIFMLPAAQTLKFVYQLYYPGGGPSLQDWVLIFAGVSVFLCILPNLHTLRSINLISGICVVTYSVMAVVLSIYDGHKLDRSSISYRLEGSGSDITFNIFNSISQVAQAYGNTMMVEIQATIRPPPVQNGYKAIALAYSVILPCFFSVASAGYWAYGWDVKAYLTFSFTTPLWALVMINMATVVQTLACFQLYMHLVFEYFETKYNDPSKGMFDPRNLINRLVVRSTMVFFMALICCALPFFGDFVALVGAAGFTPMDFVIPIIMYVHVSQPMDFVIPIIMYVHVGEVQPWWVRRASPPWISSSPSLCLFM
eukprot:TRINITY_DN340_c0_g1_i1.p1 TRINITY_DN340_c0_g1~~TRINITY_DN340_c0_g1_i1.p1  ORF type:complete len:479 (+),score=91.49 TRINITY_DN340_c0_g1_i1:377-1813(+)